MNKLNTLGIAEKLRGVGTVKTIQNRLDINRTRAIYLLYKLRKEGFVKTNYQSNKVRVYHISPENAVGGISYIDIINQHSPIKLITTEVNKIHGRKPSIEETLIYAISQRTVRYTIASLSLFRKIRNWSRLYQLAKQKNLTREVSALYYVARIYFPKLRKMPKRFRNLSSPKEKDRFRYLIKGLSSKDFKDIERRWKVYLPLNASDLSDYKGASS